MLCKTRQAEKQKAEKAMSNCVLLYPIDNATQKPLSFNFQGTPSGPNSLLQTSEIPSSWTIATGKKRKNNLAHTPKP